MNLKKRKGVDNIMCEQCGYGAEDEFHAIWGCEKVRDGWASSFDEVRKKLQNIESLSDLVCIIRAEGKKLEKFAMIVWLIWIKRNSLRTSETARPCQKIARLAAALLAKYQ